MRVPDSPDSRFDPRDMAAQDEKPHDHEVEEVENGIHVGNNASMPTENSRWC